MKIKFIKQEHLHGCAIACIAMVLGKPYAEIDRDFENDFSKKGITFAQTIDYLSEHGFQIVYKDIRHWKDKDFAKSEILKPFAPVHIVRLQSRFDSENGHQVVMDAKGKLICPGGDSDEKTRKNYLFTNVIGLYK